MIKDQVTDKKDNCECRLTSGILRTLNDRESAKNSVGQFLLEFSRTWNIAEIVQNKSQPNIAENL